MMIEQTEELLLQQITFAASRGRLALLECEATSEDVALPQRAVMLCILRGVPPESGGGERTFEPFPVAFLLNKEQAEEMMEYYEPVKDDGHKLEFRPENRPQFVIPT